MRRVIVRYKVKKERLEEHETLVRAVFDELARTSPPGIRYAAFKQPDGATFLHVAFIDASENPLDAIGAFGAFTARIRDRCEIPPEVTDLTTVGAFGFG
jgi:hypothetical protein